MRSCGDEREGRGAGRRRGLRKRGRETWGRDKPPVLTIVKRGEAKVRFRVMKGLKMDRWGGGVEYR